MNKITLRNRILNYIPYDIHCGKHSGFPSCCIIFFVTKWVWVCHYKNNKFYKAYWTKMQALKNRPEYIPCPKCLRNRTFVKLKSCPADCLLKTLLYGKNWKKKRVN